MAAQLSGATAGGRKGSLLFKDEAQRKASVAAMTQNLTGEYAVL